MPNAMSPMPAFDFINSNVVTHGESQLLILNREKGD